MIELKTPNASYRQDARLQVVVRKLKENGGGWRRRVASSDRGISQLDVKRRISQSPFPFPFPFPLSTQHLLDMDPMLILTLC